MTSQIPEDGLLEDVRILYTNYRKQTAIRTIIPQQIRFGEAQGHLEKQWFLDAFDVEKQAQRSFAMKDIRAWFLDGPAT